MPAAEPDLCIRPARAGEAGELSALAMRSKAYWGYDDTFLRAVRPMLTFTEADLAAAAVFVLQEAGGAAGMYRLTGRPPEGELEALWLDPHLIGRGVGRRLFQHALRTACGLGFAALTIESDPHAEGFYRAMGARRIGERAAPSGRTLPVLRVATVGVA